MESGGADLLNGCLGNQSAHARHFKQGGAPDNENKIARADPCATKPPVTDWAGNGGVASPRRPLEFGHFATSSPAPTRRNLRLAQKEPGRRQTVPHAKGAKDAKKKCLPLRPVREEFVQWHPTYSKMSNLQGLPRRGDHRGKDILRTDRRVALPSVTDALHFFRKKDFFFAKKD